MSLVEFLGGGTLFAILNALWRGLKQMAREEVSREIEDESRTLDLTDINDLRKALKLELEKEYNDKLEAMSKRFFEKEEVLTRRQEEQRLLYDNLHERFLQQVIANDQTKDILISVQTEMRNLQNELHIAKTEKAAAMLERDNAKKEAESAIAAAQAADTQARESLELAGRLQEAQIKSEALINSLQTQIAFLQGVEHGLVSGIRNLPIVATVDPSLLIHKMTPEKTEEKHDTEGI